MPPKPLPGFRDFYPEQFAERAHIFDTWRRVVRRYAFQEYDGPPLEPLDLYTQKSGEEIVTQLYHFVDKGDRAVALRPEMTPTFARMVGARAQSLRKPVRWFSIPQLFRYERTQKGRLREHFQLNVDIVGEADVLADAELLSVAIEIMRAFGLTSADVRARVSDRQLLNGLLTHLAIGETLWPAVYAVLDKLDRQPRDVSEEKLVAAGLSTEACSAVLGFGSLDFESMRATYGASPAVAPHVARLDEYMAHASALGVAAWIQFDLTIVRGLAYYTGIVFELFDAVGEFRAICGGGRYDSLLASLGGVDLPALGFGLGDVVLGELLRARGLMPSVESSVDVWVVQAPDDPTYPLEMLTTAARLRDRGLRVEYALRAQRKEKQVETARKAGVRYVVNLTFAHDDAAPVRVSEAARDDVHFNSIQELLETWTPSTTGNVT
ncbi:MAG: histidine--tRNA ligase [Gemmatimonas sp.]